MPEPIVEAVLAASPAAVLAALSGAVPAQGWRLTGVGGFGSVVTWEAFDSTLEITTLRAEIAPDPERPELTRLRVRRVDAALAAALDAAMLAPDRAVDTQAS